MSTDKFEELIAGLEWTGKETDHRDTVVAELVVRVRRETNSYYHYIRENGRTRKIKIADTAHMTLDAARAKVRLWNSLLAEGLPHPMLQKAEINAKQEKLAKIPLFINFVLDTYLPMKKTEVRASSYRNLEKYLTKDAARFDQKRLYEIGKPDIKLLLTSKKATPSAANQLQGALYGLFEYARKEWGYVDVNPVDDISRNEETPRDVSLDEAGIVHFWKTAREIGGHYGTIMMLDLLLGGRRAEIGGMRDTEIKDGIWTHSGERNKTGVEVKLPLPPIALDLIREVPRKPGCDLIFGTGRSDKGFTNWSVAKKKFSAKLGWANESWRPHDLRRTLVRQMEGQLGILPSITQAITNHAQDGDKQPTAFQLRIGKAHRKHYQSKNLYNEPHYMDGKKKALEAYAAHVERLVSESEALPLAA